MKERIDALIESYKKEIIDDIKKLVSYESIFSKPNETKEALDFVIKRANEMGFKTKTTRENDVGIIELSREKEHEQGNKLEREQETVGVLVHVDVVEMGDLTKWIHPPFTCVEKDGYLWGRGTVDDKGPVIMSLYVLKAIADLGIPLNKKIQLIVGTAEETQWTDMDHFKEQFPCPDYGFSPDGEFPIGFAENGYADVEILFNEPKLSQIIKLQAGDSPNTIPSKATIQFEGSKEMVFEGISAHSSVPEFGDNAISKMCRGFIGEISAEQVTVGKEDFNFIRFINDFFAKDHFAKGLDIDGKSLQTRSNTKDFQSDSVDFYNDLPETTAVPTILKITNDGVLLNINIRQRAGVTEQDIKKAFDRFSQDYAYSFSITECQDGIVVDKNLPFLQRMKQAAEAYDCDGSFISGRGTSYAKAMDNFVSWGPIFSGEVDTCHKENERLSIEKMLLATKIYTLYLAQEVLG